MFLAFLDSFIGIILENIIEDQEIFWKNKTVKEGVQKLQKG